MPNPAKFRPTQSKEETAATIAKIRKLIAEGRLNNAEIARATGYSRVGILYIKRGRNRSPRHNAYGVPKPDSLDLGKLLGIVRHRAGVICTRCEERRYLMTKTGLCIECECLNLVRQGVAKVITST